ncbi:hypothetical protein LTR37_003960 [Vermiconidia calcicola]|uniref:Uncharacterized protein n=1 Tax=Vermiconidia calcicola TaxID=1690605 RepID=A0ACC3NND1_9PEZI|nr:hypothetical protein LTR37_003960 [Vermiconidia calcicola]
MTSKDGTTTFTSHDFELLAGAMKSMKGELNVDYAKFATRCGLKNANSAKASWHAVKRKLDKMDNGAVVEPSLTITPSAETVAASDERKEERRKKRRADDSEASNDEVEMLKTKKGKTMGKKGRMAPFGGKPAGFAPIDDGDDDGEDDDEELPVATMGRGVKSE